MTYDGVCHHQLNHWNTRNPNVDIITKNCLGVNHPELSEHLWLQHRAKYKHLFWRRVKKTCHLFAQYQFYQKHKILKFSKEKYPPASNHRQ